MSDRDRRSFGSISPLTRDDGTVQAFRARFVAPDGRRVGRSFAVERVGTPAQQAASRRTAKAAADRWLRAQHGLILSDQWVPVDKTPVPTVRELAAVWLAAKTLRPASRRLYVRALETVLATFGPRRISDISVQQVAAWHAANAALAPSARAAAYRCLSSICGEAVRAGTIDVSPCRVRGGGSDPKRKPITIPTLEQVRAIEAAMPAHLRIAVVMAAGLGLRLGEVSALQRGDIDLAAGVVHVSRSFSSGRIGDTKTSAGRRSIHAPAGVLGALAHHLDQYVGPDPDAWLLVALSDPSRPIPATTISTIWRRAREVGGLPTLKFHHLRHAAVTMSAAAGATPAELQARYGHTTTEISMRYQHSTQERDRMHADHLTSIGV